MRDLEVDVAWDGSLCLLTLRGEARLEKLPRLEEAIEALLEKPASDVLVDLTLVEFMDSASMGALLRLQARVGRAGGRVVLHGPRPVVRRLLERTGLEERLPVAPDEAGARALLADD